MQVCYMCRFVILISEVTIGKMYSGMFMLFHYSLKHRIMIDKISMTVR